MIIDAKDYFIKGCGRCKRFGTPACSTRLWIEGLNELRRICLAAGLTETAKWGHPCYMHGDRNIALLGAFQSDYRLTLFNAGLMKDPEGILERPGPNSQTASMIRFVDGKQVARMEAVVSDYLREAIGNAKADLVAPKTKAEFELPNELIEAMDSDPELAEAFHALTPGRQRSYVINLNAAKASATRISRIANFCAKIIAGKGANER